jgi:hypothetical protein
MDRETALRRFERTKRFPSSGGLIQVRDSELAAAIAAVRPDHLPLCLPKMTPHFSNQPG